MPLSARTPGGGKSSADVGQGYHAFADIVTTAMPIGFACRAVWCHELLKQELIVDART